LGRRVSLFARFGLIPAFPAEKFVEVISTANADAKGTIATVLEPYAIRKWYRGSTQGTGNGSRVARDVRRHDQFISYRQIDRVQLTRWCSGPGIRRERSRSEPSIVWRKT